MKEIKKARNHVHLPFRFALGDLRRTEDYFGLQRDSSPHEFLFVHMCLCLVFLNISDYMKFDIFHLSCTDIRKKEKT